MKQNLVIKHPESGIALLQALFLAIILSVILLSFSMQSRVAVQQTSDILARVDAKLAIETAESAVLVALLTGEPQKADSGVINRYSVPFMINGVEVTLQDMAGLFQIPPYGSGAFSQFLQSAGVNRQLAQQLAAGLADWQDVDNSKTSEGAEQKDYKGLVVRNGPIQNIKELKFIKGMTPEIYQLIRPDLALFTGGHFNPITASPGVLSMYVRNQSVLTQLIQQRTAHKLEHSEFFRVTDVQLDEFNQPVFSIGVRLSFRYNSERVHLSVAKEVMVRPHADQPIAKWTLKKGHDHVN